MNVDRQRFPVRPGIFPAQVGGQGASGLVLLELAVSRGVNGGLPPVAHRAIDPHQVVVSVQVLRIDREGLPVSGGRLAEASAQPENLPERIPGDAVERELREDLRQIALRVREPPLVARDDRPEKGGLRPVRPDLLGRRERDGRVREPTLRDLGPRPVDEAVRFVRGKKGDLRPRPRRALQVSLQEEADPVIVPAKPGLVGIASLGSPRFPVIDSRFPIHSSNGQPDAVYRERRHREGQ